MRTDFLNSFTLIQRQFLALVKLSLGHTLDELLLSEEIDWPKLLKISSQQALVGVTFNGLQKMPIRKMTDKSTVMKWLAMTEAIKKRNLTINMRSVELSESLHEDGFDNVILKGQGIAQLYKVKNEDGVYNDLSLMRTSGDIDVWVGGSRDDVLNEAKRLGCIDGVVYHNVKCSVFSDVPVEIHFTPSWLCNYFRNRSLQKWFKSQFYFCVVNKIYFSDIGAISVPTLGFNRIFILQHIYRHLFGDGIGLRQLMDYYFVLQASRENLSDSEWEQSKEETMTLLHQFGMKKFCEAVMFIMREAFGMSEEAMLCKPNEKEGLFLLGEIMQAGNFGHSDKRIVHVLSESKLHSFFRITKQNFRFIRHYKEEVFWNPIYRVWHFLWRKYKGYKIK